MEAALMVDKDFFTTSRFLELIGAAKVFDRILMKIVAEIYNGKIAIQAQLLPDTICTPGSSSTSFLNDAPRKPQSFEESNMCQEAAVPCDEFAPCGEAPFEEAAVPCDEPAPSEKAVVPCDEPAPCKEAAVPCDEPAPYEEAVAPCEEAIIPCDEPSPCEAATVPFDEPAIEETPSKAKKGTKGKKEKKGTKGRQIKSEAKPVIDANIATEPEPEPILEPVPETEPKTEPEKNHDMLRQISLCLVGNNMTDGDKCEIIERIISS